MDTQFLVKEHRDFHFPPQVNLRFINLSLISTRIWRTAQFINTFLSYIVKNNSYLEQVFTHDMPPQTLLAMISNCKYITHLFLQHADITDGLVIDIAKAYPNLKLFSLHNNNNISDCCITELAERCKQLTYLNITGCERVTDTGLLSVAKYCVGLRFLCIPRTTVSLNGISEIVNKCTKLKYLILELTVRNYNNILDYTQAITFLLSRGIKPVPSALLQCIFNGIEPNWEKE